MVNLHRHREPVTIIGCMKNEKNKCPKCGEKLDHIYYKSLKWNIPDDRKGRGLCPHCQQGCVTFDVHIYHNDLEQRRYPQTDEQKYGVCCACGKRGNLWLWNEPPSP